VVWVRRQSEDIDGLTAQIGTVTTRIEELIAVMPTAQGVDPDGTAGPHADLVQGAPVLPAVDRLDEVTGTGRQAAQAIIAEVGLDMSACRGWLAT
jgi:transposase